MTIVSKATLCLAMIAGSAQAHNAPLGWTYAFKCCGTYDCSQAPTDAVKETKYGYVITGTGELIPYSDKRIKRSQDEFFHQCVAPSDLTHSICLYVPDRGF